VQPVKKYSKVSSSCIGIELVAFSVGVSPTCGGGQIVTFRVAKSFYHYSSSATIFGTNIVEKHMLHMSTAVHLTSQGVEEQLGA
jgi:hypothetical protein